MSGVTIYFAFAIVAAFLSLYVKQMRPDFALCVTLAGTAIIMAGIIPRLSLIVNDIKYLSYGEGIDGKYITAVLKIIGITYLAEFASDICKDAGENTLAMHAETIGKITIAYIALPIVEEVFSLIINLLE